MSRTQRGFTLIEVMVVVAIVAILAAIAIPNYRDYVLRSKVTEALSGLADARVKMEQYYQDNRTYPTNCVVFPAAPGPNDVQVMGTQYFTLTCSALTATTFTVTADGINDMIGFHYTIDQNNGKTSSFTGTPASNGWTSPTPNNCWAIRKGGGCS